MKTVFISARGWVAGHRRYHFNLAVSAGRAFVLEVTPTGTLYQCRAEDYKALMKTKKFTAAGF